MKARRQTDLGGIWAVTWRALVFLPMGVAAFALLVVLLGALFIPPICGVVFLFCGLWWQSGVTLAGWLLVVWAWRRFNLRRFYEAPPSYL